MKINQRIRNTFNNLSKLQVGRRMVVAMAALSIAGVTGLTTASASAQSNNRQSFPTSVADCSNWRRYGNDFDNRSECVSWVQDRNASVNANGYGGNGGGNGGGIGNVIRQLFSFLSNLLNQLFAFLGRIF